MYDLGQGRSRSGCLYCGVGDQEGRRAAASNKSELRKVTAREWDRIYPLVKDLPEEFAVLPDEEGVSIQDVVVHRAHGIGLFLRCYHDGWQTIDALFPQKNYRRNELQRYSLALG